MKPSRIVYLIVCGTLGFIVLLAVAFGVCFYPYSVEDITSLAGSEQSIYCPTLKSSWYISSLTIKSKSRSIQSYLLPQFPAILSNNLTQLSVFWSGSSIGQTHWGFWLSPNSTVSFTILSSQPSTIFWLLKGEKEFKQVSKAKKSPKNPLAFFKGTNFTINSLRIKDWDLYYWIIITPDGKEATSTAWQFQIYKTFWNTSNAKMSCFNQTTCTLPISDSNECILVEMASVYGLSRNADLTIEINKNQLILWLIVGSSLIVYCVLFGIILSISICISRRMDDRIRLLREIPLEKPYWAGGRDSTMLSSGHTAIIYTRM